MTGTVTGFVLGQTQATATSGTVAFTTSATQTSDVGSYAVTGSGLTLTNPNYTLVQAPANASALTINPATLTYTAGRATQTYGTAIPTLTGTVTGFVLGQTQAAATTGIPLHDIGDPVEQCRQLRGHRLRTVCGQGRLRLRPGGWQCLGPVDHSCDAHVRRGACHPNLRDGHPHPDGNGDRIRVGPDPGDSDHGDPRLRDRRDPVERRRELHHHRVGARRQQRQLHLRPGDGQFLRSDDQPGDAHLRGGADHPDLSDADTRRRRDGDRIRARPDPVLRDHRDAGLRDGGDRHEPSGPVRDRRLRAERLDYVFAQAAGNASALALIPFSAADLSRIDDATGSLPNTNPFAGSPGPLALYAGSLPTGLESPAAAAGPTPAGQAAATPDEIETTTVAGRFGVTYQADFVEGQEADSVPADGIGTAPDFTTFEEDVPPAAQPKTKASST